MRLNWTSCVYLPLCLSLLVVIGIWSCYAVGVEYQHLPTLPGRWPYVSDAGATPPESCIFALIFNWGAMSLAVVSTGFHRLLKQRGINTTLNKVALGFGYTSAIGVSITGCFQWTEVLVVHIIGASMSFIGGVTYSWLLVVISRKCLLQKLYPEWLVWTRIVIAAMQTIFLFLFAVLFFLRNNSTAVFTASTSSEWCLLFMQLFFYASLSYDFNQIKKFHYKLTLVDVPEVAVAPQTAAVKNNSSLSVIRV